LSRKPADRRTDRLAKIVGKTGIPIQSGLDEFCEGGCMLIGYARCSTGLQDHALQLDALNGAGCERIFVETVSGMRTDRLELKNALDFARDGHDVLVVYSLSRLARSIRHLLALGEELNQRQIGLRSLTEAVDTTTAQGRFLFSILAAMNQMEVELLRERTKAGLLAARNRGRIGGRPRSLDATKLAIAKTLLANPDLTVSDIAAQVGVTPSTLYRALPGGRSGLDQQRT
jgi:DNA invertase Pin-like site-specific DNA recombinase